MQSRGGIRTQSSKPVKFTPQIPRRCCWLTKTIYYRMWRGGGGFPNFRSKSGVIINARAETALDKKTFRESLLSRRCVIPSTGFFEWTKTGAKKKYLFRETGKSLLYMAGIYNDYGNERRYVILTTDANQSVQEIHIRMPVIVHQQEIGDWIKNETAMYKILERVPPVLTAAQA